MSKPDNKTEVTFVNSLAVNGFLNGNVNLTFLTHRWTLAFDPAEPSKPIVNVDSYTSCLLRMDLNCAMEVRDALDKIISQHTKEKGPVN